MSKKHTRKNNIYNNIIQYLPDLKNYKGYGVWYANSNNLLKN